MIKRFNDYNEIIMTKRRALWTGTSVWRYKRKDKMRERQLEMGVNQPRGGKITICKGSVRACVQASTQT